MTLPNFLIIGAQKAGTTWLAYQLERHPEIYLPKEEIHYFDKGFNYSKGLNWYEKHFESVTVEKAIGEKTPEYLWANGRGWEDHISHVHKNLAETLPNARLIITLRNPVDRAISAINHIIRSQRISPLHDINELLVGKKQHLVEGYGVIQKGMYYEQLLEYQRLYPEEQTLILIFEEMINSPRITLEKVCDFLEVSKNEALVRENKEINKSKFSRTKLAIDYHFPFLRKITNRYSHLFSSRKIQPSQATIRILKQKYEEPNQKLFDLLKQRIPAWET